MLYNKFNVTSSSPPDNPPVYPNSNYNCVVATTGQWRLSHCDEQHRVVCQSDYNTLPGIIDNMFVQSHSPIVRIFVEFSFVSSGSFGPHTDVHGPHYC